MENKITLPKLAVMLALASGKQKKVCEDFLKELFTVVAEELEKGGNVRIKGFGTFKLIDVEPRKSVNVVTGEDTTIPGHLKVIFVAAKELASRVNLPFDAFEAVEISDDLSTTDLEGDAEPSDDNSGSETDVHNPSKQGDGGEALDFVSSIIDFDPKIDLKEKYNCDDEEVKDFESPISTDSNEVNSGSTEDKEILGGEDKSPIKEIGENVPSDSAAIGIKAEVSSPEIEFDPYEEAPSGRHRFAWGFVSGFIAALIGCAAFVGICYFYGYNFDFYKTGQLAEIPSETSTGEIVIVPDSLHVDSASTLYLSDSIVSTKGNSHEEDPVPTKVSDEPVYDTVSTTRYLTTIAKEHYGNFNLWPIIYEENQKILGHPDRIPPGTRVVVPPLSKYGVDPKDAEQIKVIKQKGLDIYARFK